MLETLCQVLKVKQLWVGEIPERVVVHIYLGFCSNDLKPVDVVHEM